MKCYQCGTCTADCTSAKYGEFNPRQLMLEILEYSKSSELCWLCATCFKCYRCPKDVKPYEVLAEMRAKFIENGNVPIHVKAFVETVRSCGELDEPTFFMKLVKAGKFMDRSIVISTLKKGHIHLPKKSKSAREVGIMFQEVERIKKLEEVAKARVKFEEGEGVEA